MIEQEKKIISGPAKNYLVGLSLWLTLGLFGIASMYPLTSMWGINYLQFLPSHFGFAYWLIVVAVLYVTLGPLPENRLKSAVEKVDSWLFGGRCWSRLALAAGCMLLFWVFKAQTHLLGDGYTWLAVFGQGEAYVHKFTEPGSIWLLRRIQDILGGYTRDTALVAFQFLSVVSGGVFVYSILSITKRLFSRPAVRLLAIITFLFSGALLLFFGYVEFYPIEWAVAAVLVNVSLGALDNRGLMLAAVLMWLLAVLMHLQALYYVPGMACLVIQTLPHTRMRTALHALFWTGALVCTLLLVWLYNTRIDFEILILPFLKGRPVAPEYTVFSAIHLFDLWNLLMLVFPGAFVLATIWIVNGRQLPRDRIGIWLAFMSLGSILFLILFGAAITMARDWDVMAMSLFTPVLFVLYAIERSLVTVSCRTVLAYALMTGLIAVSFIGVSTRTTPTEARFYTLLNDRSRNGWVIYGNHFLLKGDTARYTDVMQEMASRYPDYSLLSQAYRSLESGNYKQALQQAEKLVGKDPYQADFLQLLGNVYGKYDKFELAEFYYHSSLQLKPYNAPVMNELAQLYMKQGKYDDAIAALKKARWLAPEKTFITESLALAYIHLKRYDEAVALADTLFIGDTNSPGGHLIMMSVDLNAGEMDLAAKHYEEYLKYGSNRSDYAAIKEFYSYLLE